MGYRVRGAVLRVGIQKERWKLRPEPNSDQSHSRLLKGPLTCSANPRRASEGKATLA